MKYTRIILATAIAFTFVACGGDDDDSAADTDTTTTEQVDEASDLVDPAANAEPCPTETGEIITPEMVEVGCLDTQRNDQLTINGAFNCLGGRQLYSADNGYGYVGEEFTAVDGEVAADDGYAAAYDECNP